MIFLWVAVSILSILVVICVLALVDQYLTLEVIRNRLKLEDTPEPIALPRDRSLAPSAVGLPSDLDSWPHLVALFLSTSCTTCRSIAEGMRTQPSSNVWVVLQQVRDVEHGTQWLADVGLPAERATIDLDGSVAETLGISIIPSAVLYREGDPLLAQSIPSFRQLTPLLSPPRASSLKLAQKGTVQI
jgi:hypothetical protein